MGEHLMYELVPLFDHDFECFLSLFSKFLGGLYFEGE